MTTNRQKAETLRALHRDGVLVLPNAWDVASAKIFENAGFPAIATTSTGISAARGYHDGRRIPRHEMLEVVGRIAQSVQVPVTADLEAGYAATPDEMRETTTHLLATGAVGLNLEDGLRGDCVPLVQTSHHVEKIRVVREVCRVSGMDLVINARTDIFLKAVGEPSNRLCHAVHRGNMYLQAGADSVFVPGVHDAETIAALVRQIHGPVNILATEDTPSISELARLGVARVSFGSGPLRATLGLLERIAKGVLHTGGLSTTVSGFEKQVAKTVTTARGLTSIIL